MIEQASKVVAPGSAEAAVVVQVPEPTHVQPLLTLHTRAERANNPLYYDSSQQAAVVLSSREVAMQVSEVHLRSDSRNQGPVPSRQGRHEIDAFRAGPSGGPVYVRRQGKQTPLCTFFRPCCVQKRGFLTADSVVSSHGNRRVSVYVRVVVLGRPKA